MKLDAARLRAEADAHRARMEGPLWTEGDDPDEDWMAGVTVGDVAPRPENAAPPAPPARPRAPLLPEPGVPVPESGTDPDEVLPKLEAISRAVAALAGTVARMRAEPPASPEFPAWLRAAAGNPLTYDAPDPARTSVCVRVLPSTYARLQQAQARLGLRTTAGAWECLLRLGLAAAERLPASG